MLRCLWSRGETVCGVPPESGAPARRILFSLYRGFEPTVWEIDRVEGSGSSFDQGLMVTMTMMMTLMMMLRVLQLLQLQQRCTAVTIVLWLFSSTEKAAFLSRGLAHGPNLFSGVVMMMKMIMMMSSMLRALLLFAAVAVAAELALLFSLSSGNFFAREVWMFVFDSESGCDLFAKQYSNKGICGSSNVHSSFNHRGKGEQDK